MWQIVGDIRAARAALVQVTSRLRSFIHRENGISGPFMSSSSAPDPSCKRRLEPSSLGRSYSAGLGFQAGSRSLPDAWQSKVNLLRRIFIVAVGKVYRRELYWFTVLG